MKRIICDLQGKTSPAEEQCEAEGKATQAQPSLPPPTVFVSSINIGFVQLPLLPPVPLNNCLDRPSRNIPGGPTGRSRQQPHQQKPS